MHMVLTGMDAGAVVKLLRGMMNASKAPRDQRWKDRYDDIPRTVTSAEEKVGSHQEDEPLQQTPENEKRVMEALLSTTTTYGSDKWVNVGKALQSLNWPNSLGFFNDWSERNALGHINFADLKIRWNVFGEHDVTIDWLFEETEPAKALFDPWAEYIVPEFPLEILPPLVREFVIAQSEVIGIDQASMAMCVLGAFSGAIDHRVRLKMMRHGNWYASSRLWVMLVGASSLKKTPQIKAAVKPIEDYQREQHKQYLSELAEYTKKKDDPTAEKPEEPIV